jgi:dGTP triphosphohydrolase
VNIEKQLESLSERRIIEDNKAYARQSEKTQVLVPQHGRDEVTKNRATHSYETATSALMIAAFLAKKHNVDLFDIDYQFCLYNVCLLHDIGHPPFGHDGSDIFDDVFKSMGLREGFSDNNNNLVVIKKNQIKVRDYTLVSTIKYPDKLYPYQAIELGNTLRDAISLDTEHYDQLIGVNLKGMATTIACQIMDEADRNSYTFSDMSDFLCIGNKITTIDALNVAQSFSFSEKGTDMVNEFLKVSQSGNKSLIKSYLSNIKELTNQNYEITEKGVSALDDNLLTFREFINKLTKMLYIRPIRKLPFHLSNMEKLRFVLDCALKGAFIPSKHYTSVINDGKTKEDFLRAVRDMISETSDWYILTQYDKLLLANIKKDVF